jgi:cell division protein FtsQ
MTASAVFKNNFLPPADLSSDKGRLKPSVWASMGVAVMVLLVLSGLFVVDYLFAPGKFTLNKIVTSNNLKHIDVLAINETVKQSIDGNYFSQNLTKVENKISKMPWVYDVSVKRRWPETLIVDVSEVKPIAVWQKDQWINVDGALVTMQPVNKPLMLPHLQGVDRDRVWNNFRDWQARFAALGLSLEGLRLDARGDWWLDITLSQFARRGLEISGKDDSEAISYTQVVVEDKNANAKLAKFFRAVKLKLLGDFDHIATVDLRYPNGFAINNKQTVIENKGLTHAK